MVETFNKKDIDKFEKAKIVKQYMELKNLSIRKFATRFKIAKSTVERCIIWNRITEKEYKALKDKGLTDGKIRAMISSPVEMNVTELLKKSSLDYELEAMIRQLKKNSQDPNYTEFTIELLKKAHNQLNIIEMRIERRIKKAI